MTTATNDKQPGKCAQLHQLWQEAGAGELLPRSFAIELGVASGFNPSTCRTQYQRVFKQVRDQASHAV